MSHIVKYKTNITDLNIDKLNEALTSQQFKVNGSAAKEVARGKDTVYTFRLRGWNRDITITKDGVMSFDSDYINNTNRSELDRMVQAYNAIVYRDAAYKQGCTSVNIQHATNDELHVVITK